MNGSSEHDEALLDSVAAYALGTLSEAEARDVAAHIATCAECAREYHDLRGAADLVGYAAETPEYAPNELQSARMKSAIMRHVRAASDVPPVTVPAPGSTPAPTRVRAMALAAPSHSAKVMDPTSTTAKAVRSPNSSAMRAR